ncbi:MAG TPA: ferritin-like domain-containing protein, partial [Polyangiaceae bacterium]|nr:ferritin-like domain-containing protein [Polyangiaceae bacterium]
MVAEYGSAAVTHALLGWLLRLGASPTLLHEGARIIDDELVHAEMAFEVLREAGGGSVALGGALGLELDPALSLLGNVCVQGTRVFCLGETVAVRLFKRLREGATVDVARKALDRVLADEVRHRDFGWLLLEWLSQQGEWPELSRLIVR